MTKKVEIGIPEAPPFATLDSETRKHIEDLEGELVRARGDLAAMEELGLEVSALHERIDWAEKARKIILDRFG